MKQTLKQILLQQALISASIRMSQDNTKKEEVPKSNIEKEKSESKENYSETKE